MQRIRRMVLSAAISRNRWSKWLKQSARNLKLASGDH